MYTDNYIYIYIYIYEYISSSSYHLELGSAQLEISNVLKYHSVLSSVLTLLAFLLNRVNAPARISNARVGISIFYRLFPHPPLAPGFA